MMVNGWEVVAEADLVIKLDQKLQIPEAPQHCPGDRKRHLLDPSNYDCDGG
jgi:hypothetical protein